MSGTDVPGLVLDQPAFRGGAGLAPDSKGEIQGVLQSPVASRQSRVVGGQHLLILSAAKDLLSMSSESRILGPSLRSG